MDVYKTKDGGAQGWSGADRILVCIGPDALSGKLVRVAKRMASGLKSPWTALYIENERHYRLSREGQEAVERTLRLAERMGGKTEIMQGQNAQDDILSYAQANGITKIIVGKTVRSAALARNTLRDARRPDHPRLRRYRRLCRSGRWRRRPQEWCLNRLSGKRSNRPGMYYVSAPADDGLILHRRSAADGARQTYVAQSVTIW